MELAEYYHESVLLKETIEWLNPQKGLIYIDATAGGGGHTAEIAKIIYPEGRVIGLDVDPEAIIAATEKTLPWKEVVTILRSSYSKIPEVLQNLNIEKITGGIIFDLGASSHQFLTAERGFSFLKEAPLDMRFNPESSRSAYDIVNKLSKEELTRIFNEYGEERYSARIAGKIVEKRKIQPIKTTTELANIAKSAYPYGHHKIHPATRIFQALRIAVNDELNQAEKTLKEVIPLLEKNARIVVISFHSLEDRLVKNLFKYYSLKCSCNFSQTTCTCGGAQLEVLTKKPLTASQEEKRKNPSARSAKLRVARKM